MAKTPNIPVQDEQPVDESEIFEDTSDAFARVPTESLPPPPEDKPRKSGKGKRKEPRIVVERIAPLPPADDDGMDPLDAAEEIVGMMDQLFALAVMFRGYDKIMIPSPAGGVMPLLEMATPDEKAKERTKKAVARMLKTAGATMSPGMGLAFTAFGCYGAPIIALEVARASVKKQTAG